MSQLYLDIAKNDRIEVDDGRIVVMAQKLRNHAYGDEKVRVRIHAEKSIPIKLVKCSSVDEEPHIEKEIEQGG